MRIAPPLPSASMEQVWGGYGSGSTGNASREASFAEELKAGISKVDQLQHRADEARDTAAIEGAVNIHETLLKAEEADLSLRLLVRARTKALEAYQEVMRMQF